MQSIRKFQKSIMSKAGFTIIESLVAITVLMLIVSGTSGAVQKGIESYIFSKNEISAFYLAQEGVEMIRNVRDENGLASAHWLAGIAQSISDPCYFGKVCTVDAITGNIASCPSGAGTCPVLRQDLTNGYYGYNPAWTLTGFRREIVLDQISSDEISILVTVDWGKGAVTRQFRARENIMNWQ